MEIYADVVFFINFCMNAFIFYIGAKLMKRRVRALRLIIGALVTAGMHCVFMVIGANGAIGVVLSIFILVAGLLIVFPFSGLKELLMGAFICYAVALATGGAAMAMVYYGNLPDVLGNALVISQSGVSVKILFAAVAASYILYKAILIVYKRYFSAQKAFHDICIYLNGKESRVKALLDTGNELKEPISKAPVIVAEFNAIKELLSPGFQEIFESNKEDILPELLYGIGDSDLILRIRLVPYASVGRRNGMLVGFKPDKIRFSEGQQDENGFVVAVYNGKLGDGYNALVPYNNFR